MRPFQRQFLELCLELEALRFGEFTLKSKRISPYFFNAGQFRTGDALRRLGSCYAQAISAEGLRFDMLYGPAYKGIPLASAVAIAFASNYDRDVPFAFNRKEVKDHGEGGHLVGAPLKGRVLVVDDVVSAGTSVGESVDIIKGQGAELAGVALALDRQERGTDHRSAVQQIKDTWNVPVVSVVNLNDLVGYLGGTPGQSDIYDSMITYRQQYAARDDD